MSNHAGPSDAILEVLFAAEAQRQATVAAVAAAFVETQPHLDVRKVEEVLRAGLEERDPDVDEQTLVETLILLPPFLEQNALRWNWSGAPGAA